MACDVTHVGQEKFVTIVDCGPSRFVVWQKVNHEDETEVAACLRKVFQWYGAPRELLMDNGRAFRSKKVKDLCDNWAVTQLFRAAYKPRGNGIVKRNHRTVKRIKARRGGTVEEAVQAYNRTPRGLLYAVPAEIMFGRSITNPTVRKARGSEHHPEEGGASGHNTERTREYREGDKAVFKPPNVRCDTRWSPGTVMKVNSRWNVNGVPRHAQDVRLARPGGGGRQRAGTVPWPEIMINAAPGQEEPPAARQDTATTSSEDWDDTVSQQWDEERWKSLPFTDDEPLDDQQEEPEAEQELALENPEQDTAQEEVTVRRSTRARRAPDRYESGKTNCQMIRYQRRTPSREGVVTMRLLLLFGRLSSQG